MECPKCGKSTLFDEPRCPACGHDFGWEPASPDCPHSLKSRRSHPDVAVGFSLLLGGMCGLFAGGRTPDNWSVLSVATIGLCLSAAIVACVGKSPRTVFRLATVAIVLTLVIMFTGSSHWKIGGIWLFDIVAIALLGLAVLGAAHPDDNHASGLSVWRLLAYVIVIAILPQILGFLSGMIVGLLKHQHDQEKLAALQTANVLRRFTLIIYVLAIYVEAFRRCVPRARIRRGIAIYLGATVLAIAFSMIMDNLVMHWALGYRWLLAVIVSYVLVHALLAAIALLVVGLLDRKRHISAPITVDGGKEEPRPACD